jgi:hypothetical protein
VSGLPTFRAFVRHRADPLVRYDDWAAIEVAQRYYDQADEAPTPQRARYLRMWGDHVTVMGIRS